MLPPLPPPLLLRLRCCIGSAAVALVAPPPPPPPPPPAAAAAASLHSWCPNLQGIYHRDVKLENLLLSKPALEQGCQLKLCDFGFSKVGARGTPAVCVGKRCNAAELPRATVAAQLRSSRPGGRDSPRSWAASPRISTAAGRDCVSSYSDQSVRHRLFVSSGRGGAGAATQHGGHACLCGSRGADQLAGGCCRDSVAAQRISFRLCWACPSTRM